MIIILLILATITIRAISGDNGIIRKTGEAVNAYKIAENKEQETLQYLYGELNPNQEITISLGQLKDIIKDEIKESKKDDKLNAWPVGSIYISTENISPEQLFGGTWESYGQGRTLVGAGSGTDSNSETKIFEANSTGGEYSHKLTVEEIPSHSHKSGVTARGFEVNGFKGNHTAQVMFNPNDGTKSTGDTGGSESHNNIQPYIVTYMWRRMS